MKKLYKKILIVIGLKIVEILAVAACLVAFGFILYGLIQLIIMLGVADLLVTIFIYVVLGVVGLYGLYLVGAGIREWFKWNWNKAEEILITKQEVKEFIWTKKR